MTNNTNFVRYTIFWSQATSILMLSVNKKTLPFAEGI